MRTSTKVGLGLIALLAAAWYAKRSGTGPGASDAISPIDEPVPGDEPVDERDVPSDQP